eukprot:gene4947-6920_t
MVNCLCCVSDAEGEMFGCILFHYQCGVCPIKCCNYDDNGLCWGCVCFQCQIDPCFLQRMFLKCCCGIIPCGCIAEETILKICCCNPPKSGTDAN